MKILVIGSGGREHALVWKLAQSPRVKKITCVPGNGGIAKEAECIPLSVEDTAKLAEFAVEKEIDLTVVGPELPLSRGLVDVFENRGLKVFGPRKNAAVIESSKCFTKEFCTRHDIPTAPYVICSNASEAKEAVQNQKRFPVVVKADGLAAGKGVVVAKTKGAALEAIEEMMVHEKFGEAGKKVILEEFLTGEEATYMVITDGTHFQPLESAKDHKRIFDGDQGPNTGGMGAYSPAPVVSKTVEEKIKRKIIRPLLDGMRKEERTYRGILYAGLIIKNGEPRLVEFNCRFGDPEAQAILVRMKSDLVTLMEGSLTGELGDHEIEFLPQASVCLVLASRGYPGSYENGKVISGLEKTAKMKDVFVFHAGTKLDKKNFLTNGGRVLGVTARAPTLKAAIDRAYSAVGFLSWEGMHYRKDIGRKGLI